MNDLMVRNDLPICHCSLYEDITSFIDRYVLVTIRNIPAIFLNILIPFSLSIVLYFEIYQACALPISLGLMNTGSGIREISVSRKTLK